MKIMYPLEKQRDYTELRFSLRSVEKWMPKLEVIIVGDTVPDWITGVTHINVPDISNRKQLSIKRKIIAALHYAKHEIFFMNDDVYLLQKPVLDYYWHGTLKQHTSEVGAGILNNELEILGKQTKDFDGHYPLVYRQSFIQVMRNFSDDTIIKSAYCNFLGIEGVEMPDCKFAKPEPDEIIRGAIRVRPAISTGARSLPSVLPYLEKLFPTPSIYEV